MSGIVAEEILDPYNDEAEHCNWRYNSTSFWQILLSDCVAKDVENESYGPFATQGPRECSSSCF